jgi:hypothetical protein
MGGDALALADHFVRREPEGRSAKRGRARAERPRAVGRRLGVALYDAQLLGREPEPLAGDLPVHRFVALALALGADGNGRAATRIEAQLGVLEGRR